MRYTKVILIAKAPPSGSPISAPCRLAAWRRVWCFKVDLAVFFVFFVDRESTNPGKGKTVFVRQTQLGNRMTLRAAALRPFERTLGLAAKEKNAGIADGQTPKLLAGSLFGPFGPMFLHSGPAASMPPFDIRRAFSFGLALFPSECPGSLRDASAVFLAPEDIAHAGRPIFLREPRSCEFQNLRLAAWARGGADFCAFCSSSLAKMGKPEPAKKWSAKRSAF